MTVQNPACGSTGWGFVIHPCNPPPPPNERDCAALIVGGTPFICVDGQMSLTAQLLFNGSTVPTDNWMWSASGGATIDASDGANATVTFESGGAGTITASFTGGETTPCDAQVASFTAQAIVVDLDVDSDNNDLFGQPGRTDQEEETELFPGPSVAPGKIVFTGIGDSDNDLVPDFADGLGIYESNGSAGNRFTPLVLEVPDRSLFTSASFAQIKIIYELSDPNGIAMYGPASDPHF